MNIKKVCYLLSALSLSVILTGCNNTTTQSDLTFETQSVRLEQDSKKSQYAVQKEQLMRQIAATEKRIETMKNVIEKYREKIAKIEVLEQANQKDKEQVMWEQWAYEQEESFGKEKNREKERQEKLEERGLQFECPPIENVCPLVLGCARLPATMDPKTGCVKTCGKLVKNDGTGYCDEKDMPIPKRPPFPDIACPAVLCAEIPWCTYPWRAYTDPRTWCSSNCQPSECTTDKGTFKCGDNVCEKEKGETALICKSDCLAEVVSDLRRKNTNQNIVQQFPQNIAF